MRMQHAPHKPRSTTLKKVKTPLKCLHHLKINPFIIILLAAISFNCANSLRVIPLQFQRKNRQILNKKLSSAPPLPLPRKKQTMPNQPQPSKNVVYGADDKLFGCIERSHASTGKSFGRFLDSGTGTHSLRWMASLMGDNRKTDLSIDDYTAITADEGMRINVLKEAESLGIEENGSIIIGNWQAAGPEEEELCHGEMYDTILADYLVGAMDGFSPYYQDLIFPRLTKHLRPGGRLYVVGLNPIPDNAQGDANIFCKVTRLRDACILLAGHRCYREYPVDWIERHMEKAGLKIVSSSQFPIMYSHAAIVRQLNVARSKLPLFPSKALAKEMGEAIDALEEESKEAIDRSPNKRLQLGFDYVVSAEKPMQEPMQRD